MDTEFCQYPLCIHWDNLVIFILHFFNVVYHIGWLAYIHPSLHPWDKSHLIMVYDPSCNCCCLVTKSWVQLFETPLTAAHQTSLSLTIFQSLPKFMSIESMMPSNNLILCHPLLLLPSIFPSIGAFSTEMAFCIRWPKYWSFSFSINPSNEYSGLISFRID